MRRPSQLRLAALLGASAAVVGALALTFLASRLLGGAGQLGFGNFNGAGLVEGVVFIAAFSTGLRYARSLLRLPSPTLLSFGLIAPPPARRVAATVPIVDAAQGLQTLIDNRIVIVQEHGVPIGVSGVRRERLTSWEDLVKIDGRVAVTDLRRLLAHEPVVVVLDGGRAVGVITQEMYLGGLWGSVR